MGHRKNVSVYDAIDFEPPPSPNSTVAAISVDLRVFFPPNATALDILPHFEATVEKVRAQLKEIAPCG